MFAAKGTHTKNKGNNTPDIFKPNNQSTALIQPQVQVRQPGDAYEVEADRAVDHLVYGKQEASPTNDPWQQTSLIPQQAKLREPQLMPEEESIQEESLVEQGVSQTQSIAVASPPPIDEDDVEQTGVEETVQAEDREQTTATDAATSDTGVLSGSGGSSGASSETAVAGTALNAESSQGLLDSLADQTPTGFMRGMQEAKSLAPQIQQAENEDLINNLPEITQPTGLPVSSVETPEVALSFAPQALETTDAVNEEGPLQIEERHQQIEGNINIANVETPRSNSDQDQSFAHNIRSATSALPTSDASINTSAGGRPSVNLTGTANPNLNQEGQQLADENILEQQAQADGNINNDFGESTIYPGYNELEQLRPERIERTPAAIGESALEPFPETSAEVYASFDNQAQASTSEQLDAEMARHEVERERMTVESENERTQGMAEIDLETERTRAEQEAIQTGAQEEVAGHRETWRSENEAVRDEYSQRSAAQRATIDAQIDSEVSTTEAQVDTELTNAEASAETERQSAETEATSRREAAEREQEGQGFWDRVTSAVSSFFDALKEGLNALFNAVRRAVAFIIEAAKSAVNALIDAARSLIVSLIEGFGTFLKGLVSIVFAAFPEIANRINGWIDQAVDLAVSAVNALADALKEIANAILDAIGAVLDFILAAYQAFYNALLDVLEFITGGLIKIIQFLINLQIGAWYAPLEFFGALAEVALGGNPADPLKDVEVPLGKEGEWANAMGINQQDSDTGTTMQEGQIPTELQHILTRSQLADSDVELEPNPAVELGPELTANVSMLRDGETMELGGAGADAVTTAEFQASAADAAGYSLGGQNEGDLQENVTQSTEAVAENVETETSGPDWRNMSNEQKLDHYNAQMLVESEEVGNQEPTPGKVTPEPSTDMGPEALITKTGRLDIAQRLAFMGQQMMTGLQVFWNKNKVWIIAALVTALLLAGVIAFFTGGAGLALAVDIIVKAMILIFGAYAVYQALGHIWDYVKKAWAGDAQGAGKSLAMAMAVIVMEFLLDKILLGMGKVFKSMLKAFKTTRVGRMVRTGMVVVRRGRRAVRRTVRRGISRIKGNKLVVSMRSMIGKRVKSFNELRENILRRFGFRRVWFERHGRFIELWGQFNGKVLMSVTDVDNNRTINIENKPDAGPLGSITPNGGIVIDDIGNQFSRNVDALDNVGHQTQLADTFDDLAGRTDDASRRAKIQTGNPRTSTRSDWDMHEQGVHANLANTHPGQTTAQQLTLDVYDANGDLVTTIRVDSAAMDVNGNITLIDAKHQANGLVANGNTNPLNVVTVNQGVGYPLIQNGNIGSVQARGAAARDLGILNTDLSSRLNPRIEIHTNDISGNIVRMDLDGNLI